MVDILLYALIAGLLMASISGPLGALVVWQRLAYYGDTLAHSALLGVALGIVLQLPVQLAVMLSCIAIALILATLQQRLRVSIDSLLGIMAHSSIALGLVVLALIDGPALDLNSFLFGDLLAVTLGDLAGLAMVVSIVGACLIYCWNSLVAMAAHEELAAVEGLPVFRLRLLMMVLIAMTVATAMKVVGILLVTALLIVPAATASRISRSPEQVALGAIAMGITAVAAGLGLAWQMDTPAGPSIVLCATALFLLSQILPRRNPA